MLFSKKSKDSMEFGNCKKCPQILRCMLSNVIVLKGECNVCKKEGFYCFERNDVILSTGTTTHGLPFSFAVSIGEANAGCPLVVVDEINDLYGNIFKHIVCASCRDSVQRSTRRHGGWLRRKR